MKTELSTQNPESFFVFVPFDSMVDRGNGFYLLNIFK